MATDPVVADLLDVITTHGWAVRLVSPRVGEDVVSFAYTIGLTAMGHAEVVEQGLPGDVGHAFLNLVGDEVRNGRRFEPGTVVTDLSANGEPVVFLKVADVSELVAIEQVYGTIDAIQLVWSDRDGRLPWDEGFGPGPEGQPLLGTWRGAEDDRS